MTRAAFIAEHRPTLLDNLAASPAGAAAEIAPGEGTLCVAPNARPDVLGEGAPWTAILDMGAPTLIGYGQSPAEALDDLTSGAQFWDAREDRLPLGHYLECAISVILPGETRDLKHGRTLTLTRHDDDDWQAVLQRPQRVTISASADTREAALAGLRAAARKEYPDLACLLRHSHAWQQAGTAPQSCVWWPLAEGTLTAMRSPDFSGWTVVLSDTPNPPHGEGTEATGPDLPSALQALADLLQQETAA